ncbi:DUF87 domain-containing protein [Mycoplasma sp. Pen4]|uniref:DNA topoisomerase n=1 Tax=Mycoplasma sp. Pen4 TaxID=640330 RepID=UPI001654816F|nr:DNA topoisomerase [Mycoplasma sp. Pen4]QNM93760.1 DUF87 domain-containing protein [Mycoplasma sp. Pen4]QNM93856.1 DUF87 domain-containing protein [Mycoplasma sp. Pen4]
MSKKLFIIESPNKIKKLREILGPGYDVKATVGHFRELSNKGEANIGVDASFNPDFVISDNKKENWNNIIQNVDKWYDEIFIATDPDREGEAIAFHVWWCLPKKVKDKGIVKRITFNEITSSAVESAIANPRELDKNLINSQFLRQIGDKLIGYKGSRAVRKVANVPSTGRVQGVALKLVIDREKEIKNHIEIIKKKYQAIFKDDISNNVTASHVNDDLKEIIYELNEQPCPVGINLKLINQITKDETITEPPKPFITSTLLKKGISLGMKTDETQKAMQELYEKGLYDLHFLVINQAETIEELKEIENKNYRLCRKYKINLNPLPFKQFDAFAQMCLITTNNLKEQLEISSYNLTHGWAFDNALNNDGNLNLQSLTKETGEPLIINRFFKNSSKRSNYNSFTLGSSGRGKSTFLGKEILSLLAENQRVYVIDIQGEYTKLASQFGGDVLDLGSGKETTVNPLQIRVQLYDEDEIDETSVKLIINKHIEWLEQYFRLVAPEWNNSYIMMLIKVIKALYKEFGIYNFKTINDVIDFDYPTISELIAFAHNYQIDDAINSKTKEIMLVDIIETLEYLFENNGKYQYLYNGKTNLDLDGDFLVFNISKLAIADEELSAVGIFVLLSYLQTKIFNNFILDKEVNTTILVDEFHRFKDNKLTLDALFFMTKTVRKYNAGMLFATQNPSDFLSSADASKKSEAIMMNSQYSYFFGLRANDLNAVQELFKNSGGLNNSTTRFLAEAEIGDCLASLHEFSKIQAEVYYNEFEKSILFRQGSFGKE